MVLIAGLMATQLLLGVFLGIAAVWLVLGGIAMALVLAGLAWAPGWRSDVAISPRSLACVAALAAALLVLGGEGRFTYANTDWQVRDAVLRDLTLYPWPFAYAGPPAQMLRAPLGMYLAPALIGKLAGSSVRVAEVALLVQNTALLAALLGLGACLWRTQRQRLIGLIVFLGFSGMDVVGQALAHQPLTLHLEQWAGMQFSAHVTQVFWVPQHAMAGWIFALFYLLWLDRRLPLAAVFAVMPLLALLSPLALMGAVPFAAHAFVASAAQRRLGVQDLAWPALIGLVCLPGLAYLTAGSSAVGAGASRANFHAYALFIVLEVGAYLFALWLARGHLRFGRPAAVVVGLVLLAVPFGQVGDSVDFTMRASIPALAILSVMVADMLAEESARLRLALREARLFAGIAFLIGLATPAGEIVRALAWPRSPGVVCSYFGVVPGGYSTYVAPVARMPAAIRPTHPALITPHDPTRCWPGPWPDAVTGRDTIHHGDPAAILR